LQVCGDIAFAVLRARHRLRTPLEWELFEDADWHLLTLQRTITFRHSSLGGMTPAEYDDQFGLNPRAA
jgi:hypothetical protein